MVCYILSNFVNKYIHCFLSLNLTENTENLKLPGMGTVLFSAESHPRDTEGEPLVGHWIYAWGTSIIRDKKGFQYSPLKNYRRVHKSSTNSETTCVSISFKGHYKGFQIDSTQKKSKTHVVQLRWWGVRPESHHGDWDTSRASNGFQRQQPKIQWIGLRENLQETMVFTIKYRSFL